MKRIKIYLFSHRQFTTKKNSFSFCFPCLTLSLWILLLLFSLQQLFVIFKQQWLRTNGNSKSTEIVEPSGTSENQRQKKPSEKKNEIHRKRKYLNGGVTAAISMYLLLLLLFS